MNALKIRKSLCYWLIVFLLVVPVAYHATLSSQASHTMLLKQVQLTQETMAPLKHAQTYQALSEVCGVELIFDHKRQLYEVLTEDLKNIADDIPNLYPHVYQLYNFLYKGVSNLLNAYLMLIDAVLFFAECLFLLAPGIVISLSLGYLDWKSRKDNFEFASPNKMRRRVLIAKMYLCGLSVILFWSFVFSPTLLLWYLATGSVLCGALISCVQKQI